MANTQNLDDFVDECSVLNMVEDIEFWTYV